VAVLGPATEPCSEQSLPGMHSGRETAGAQRRRREPERGALHQVLREHLATVLVRSNEQEGPGLPRFVTRELERALHFRC